MFGDTEPRDGAVRVEPIETENKDLPLTVPAPRRKSSPTRLICLVNRAIEQGEYYAGEKRSEPLSTHRRGRSSTIDFSAVVNVGYYSYTDSNTREPTKTIQMTLDEQLVRAVDSAGELAY